MKKRIFVCLVIGVGLFCNACSGSLNPSSSFSATESLPPSSVSKAFSETFSSENPVSSAVGGTSVSTGENDSNLEFYKSLSDIPWAEIDYTNDKNGLSKNGVSWYDAPGNQKIGDIAFSNDQFLFVQIFFPTDEYRWCAIEYSSDPAYSYFLPTQADNKMFMQVKDDLLLVDDEEGFNTKTLQWFTNGRVVENAEIY